MYEQHFGLTERPFSIAPDPRFLYMSQRHREALAHLLYGVGEGGGFVQLTGEVGTGKTTICRCLLEQLPENVDVALILNPRVTGLELIASLCDELQIDYPKHVVSAKELTDALNKYLLEAHARGRRTVMMIDEAQNLDKDALEQVRLLTNLETTREKLLQIILVGQPELRDMLAREDLRQLSQRITARYHLEPIVSEDTAAYIRHRLEVCDATANLFTDKAVKRIQRYSKGIPRIINVLCDRSLLGAYVEGKRQVNAGIVQRAAAEVLPEESHRKPRQIAWWATGLLSLGSLALAMWLGPQLLSQFSSASDRKTPAYVGETESVAEEKTGIAKPVLERTAAVPSIPQVASDLEALLSNAGPVAEKRAWSGLFEQWGFQSAAINIAEACAQALRVQLGCLQRSGSWADMVRFNRPALLLLAAPDGRRVPVLVKSIQAGQVEVELDGQSLQASESELQRFWFGDYRLLWQTPPGGRKTLRPGNSGADVRWLREQLQLVLGLAVDERGSKHYNQQVKHLAQQFQLSQGLKADGVAGPETIIYLNSAIQRPGVPLLLVGN